MIEEPLRRSPSAALIATHIRNELGYPEAERRRLSRTESVYYPGFLVAPSTKDQHTRVVVSWSGADEDVIIRKELREIYNLLIDLGYLVAIPSPSVVHVLPYELRHEAINGWESDQ